MADRSVVVRLKANISDFQSGMAQAGRAATDFGRQVSGQGSASREQMEQIGRAGLIMSGSLVLGFGLAAKAAIDWESAWAGVTKTVDGSDEQMAELEDGLRRLATTLPATHGEIAAVAEAAGQLGIQRESIIGFTETMIALGETTNLTADEAATALAQMANIMQTSQSDVDRMASTLVALGNAGASTESQILDMSLRLAGAGQLIGATEADVMALANAMASVGIEAQLGGGSMSRVMQRIYTAVQDGGEALDEFAAIAGMSSSEFAAAFEDDPMRAIDQFVQGLGRIDASGDNVIGTLRDLGIRGTEETSVLLRLVGAGDLLAASLDLGSQAWIENVALTQEAEKRYQTTASQLQVMRNQVTDLAIDAGDTLLPAIQGVVGVLGTLTDGLSAMPDEMRAVAMGFGGVVAAGTGVIGIVGTMAPKIQALQASLMAMGSGGQFVARNMGRMAAAAGVAGIAIAGITYVMGQNAQKAAEAEERVRGFEEAIRDAGDAASGYDARLMEIVQGTPALARMMLDAQVSVEDLRAAMLGTDEAWAAMVENLTGDLGENMQADFIRSSLNGMRTEAALAAENVEDTNAALEQSGGVAQSSVPGVDALGNEFGETAEQATDAEKAVKQYQDSLRAMMDPLFGAVDAMDAHREAQQGVVEAEWAVIEAQAAYEEAVRQHGRTSDEATAAALELMGAQQGVEDANYNVVRSAMDVDGAMTSLAIQVENGALTVDQATGRLQAWVDQGLITQEQADRVAGSFGNVDKQAQKLDGRNLNMTVNADTWTAELALGRVYAAASKIPTKIAMHVAAGSIPVYDDGGVHPGPRGVHSLALVAGGETIVPTHKTSVPAGVGAVGATTIVNIYATGIGERQLALAVRDSIATAKRRGVQFA